MSTLGGSGVREGVGDLQEEESGGDEADGISLKRTRLIKTFIKINFISPSRPSSSAGAT